MRVSVSSIIAEQVATGTKSLDELLTACRAAGLDVVMAQVYAGAQSMASTHKISRGVLPRTFCALESTEVVEPSLVAPGAPVAKRRAVKAVTQRVPNERILAELEQLLGPSIPRPPDKYAYCWVLLGDTTTEHIMYKTERVIGRTPTQWFTTRQGENTVVGLL